MRLVFNANLKFLFISFTVDCDTYFKNYICGVIGPQVMVFSLIWAVLCAVASGLFSEVITKLQNDKWDQSNDERIQWRYQHALAAMVRPAGFGSTVSFFTFIFGPRTF